MGKHIVSTVAVRMKGISKKFGGVQALDNVGFEVLAGEIHAPSDCQLYSIGLPIACTFSQKGASKPRLTL